MKNINLPEEILVEILSRVPITSLARLRFTSKRWNTLIGDGTLAKKESLVIMLTNFRVCLLNVDFHGIQNNVAPFVKITSQFNLKDPLSNFSKDVVISEISYCDNGLLLCTTEDNRLVVWNPCSRETRWIQPENSCTELDVYALSKSSSNKYKILRVHHKHKPSFLDPCVVEFEIYDFTSNSWRGVGETSDWFILWYWRRGTSMDGNTYWIVFTQKADASEVILIMFDFSTEKFKRISLPEDPENKFKVSDMALSVTREGQQLSLLVISTAHFIETNFWVATKSESTGVMSWRKFLSLSELNMPPYRCGWRVGMSFLADEKNKLVLYCNKQSFSKNLVFIPGEVNYLEVDHLDAAEYTVTSPTPVIFGYVPSLVQIQQSI